MLLLENDFVEKRAASPGGGGGPRAPARIPAKPTRQTADAPTQTWVGEGWPGAGAEKASGAEGAGRQVTGAMGEELEGRLQAACASARWARSCARRAREGGFDESRPSSGPALIAAARAAWWEDTGVLGWLEAFRGHPRIGDLENLKARFGAAGAAQAAGEQGGAVEAATEEGLEALREENLAYEEKFGHVFLICASGKSASEILSALRERLGNTPERELMNAAVEQMKITELRLARDFPHVIVPSGSARSSSAERRAEQLKAHLRSPVTTHVLDIGAGRPAQGVAVSLERRCDGSRDAWERLASGRTNADGRVGDLLPPGGHMDAGTYRITFGTEAYAAATGRDTFYPHVPIVWQIAPGQEQQHFHVPLTFSPFGYSTYRGS